MRGPYHTRRNSSIRLLAGISTRRVSASPSASAAAKAEGLALTRRVVMPANNLMLLFRRVR